MAVSAYEVISTTTLGTTQNQVDFSSIPGSYTDLVLIMTGGVTSSADVWLRMNGDTASNYSRTRLYADGTTVASSRNSSVSAIFVSVGTVGSNANMVIQIQVSNYQKYLTDNNVKVNFYLPKIKSLMFHLTQMQLLMLAS